MTNNNSLPLNNTLEELLILRTALEQEDVQQFLSVLQKVSSQIFLFLEIILALLVGSQAIQSMKYPHIIQGYNNHTILFLLSILFSIEQAIQAYISPVRRWRALKSAERCVNSEIWQFRTRVGKQSCDLQYSEKIIRNMTSFLNLTSQNLLEKANLSESNLYGRQSYWINSKYQQKNWNKENFRIRSDYNEMFNDENDLQALDINLTSDTTRQESIIDNHYSPLTPEFYFRFRVIPELNFQQKRMPKYNILMFYLTMIILILGATLPFLAFLDENMYVALLTLLIGQIIQFRDWNGQDKKVERYNQTINAIMEVMTKWISLNRTKKNSRDVVESLVLKIEHLITDESSRWDSTRKIKKEDNDDEEKEEVKKNLDKI